MADSEGDYNGWQQERPKGQTVRQVQDDRLESAIPTGSIGPWTTTQSMWLRWRVRQVSLPMTQAFATLPVSLQKGARPSAKQQSLMAMRMACRGRTYALLGENWGSRFELCSTFSSMCNRYVSPDAADIERFWNIGARQPWHTSLRQTEMFPRAKGPFVRRTSSGEREAVVGQWGLIPWFAKEAELAYSTNNARSEELAKKATFKLPWARGQRCVVPALQYYEPCWESGRNVWWRFRRSDGAPWGLAGLWNRWTDKSTGELVESYTLLTLNVDSHPLLSRMHKPDARLPPDQQDKRAVVPIAFSDVDRWLGGALDDAQALLNVPPVEAYDAAPAAA